MDVAVSGDWILNRRISTVDDAGFRSLINRFRDAAVAVAHFESLLTDYDAPGVYPAAEAGGTWMRSPRHVAEELGWAGLDMVSHASNHSLDYGYGGLRETLRALDNAGIQHAGTGQTLGDARAPTYLETPHGRVALLSATTSFPPWTRAGEARRDMPGRPGLNPLRYHHVVDPATLETLRDLAVRFNHWVVQNETEWVFHAPGVHNSVTKVIEGEPDDGVRAVVDERDRTGNLNAIRDAAHQADFVIFHLHTHEWDPDGDLSTPPEFVEQFARDCIDAGADVFLGQGSHSPLRGIEIYEGRPIFYDPGDFFLMSETVERLPAEYYYNFEPDLDVHPLEATPADGFTARAELFTDAENPPGGYHTGSMSATTVPVCSFDGNQLRRIDLYPGVWPDDPSMGEFGVPTRAEGSAARDVIETVADLSASYGTSVEYTDGTGVIELP